jgi:signal transduction histidine kinase
VSRSSRRPLSFRAPRKPRDPLQVNLRRVVRLILLLVIVPTVVLTGIGIAVVFARKDLSQLVLGLLISSFAASVIAGAVLLLVLTGRGARLARVQETFLSQMGHELMTPLAGIGLHTQILSGMDLPADAERSIEAIDHERRRLQDLVERTLQWREVRSKKHLYRRQRTDAAEVVARALARAADRDQIVLREPAAGLVLSGDPEALADALGNLLRNAAKYAGEVHPIELTARRWGRLAVFSVSDRGPGLPPGPSEHLFEPFYRHVPEGRPDPGGTGLGLSITRQIVEDHGGRVAACPRPRGGATFFFTVPLGDRG